MKIENDIILVRHAENEQNEHLTNNLLPLTKKGVIQAYEASKLLIGKYDIAIASSSKRAIMTAKIITDNGPVICDERLLERGWGNSEQDGKETDEEAKIRFKNFLDDITNKYKNKRLLLVTHGSLMRLAQDVIEEKIAPREPIDNCTIIAYKRNKEKKIIKTKKKTTIR